MKILVAALALSGSLFLYRMADYVMTRHTVSQKISSIAELHQREKIEQPRNAADLQAQIGAAAKAAAVRRLFNVGTSGSQGLSAIIIDWEGPLASLRMLDSLTDKGIVGRCEQLRVTALDNEMTRISAAFAPGNGTQISTASVIGQLAWDSQAFRPIVREKTEDPLIAQARALKKEEQTRQKEQEKANDEQKKREEAARLEAKKQEIQSDLYLTGIVNNGHEPLAIVSSRSNGGRTLMVRNGDQIKEATITTIDEKNGEIRLDYQGRFQLQLKIGAAPGTLP